MIGIAPPATAAKVMLPATAASIIAAAGRPPPHSMLMAATIAPEQMPSISAVPASPRSPRSAVASVRLSGSVPTVRVSACMATLSPSVSTSGRKNASSTTSLRRSSKSHAITAHSTPPPMLHSSHGMRMRKLSHAVIDSACPRSRPSVWNTWRTRSRSARSSCSRAYCSTSIAPTRRPSRSTTGIASSRRLRKISSASSSDMSMGIVVSSVRITSPTRSCGDEKSSARVGT